MTWQFLWTFSLLCVSSSKYLVEWLIKENKKLVERMQLYCIGHWEAFFWHVALKRFHYCCPYWPGKDCATSRSGSPSWSQPYIFCWAYWNLKLSCDVLIHKWTSLSNSYSEESWESLRLSFSWIYKKHWKSPDCTTLCDACVKAVSRSP